MLASIVTVFRCMPRKVIDVDGPSIFDDLTGALICSQTGSIALGFCTQTAESAEPAVRKSSK